MKESKEELSFTKQVASQVVDYLFSLAVPVAILTYVAPQKSFNFIADSAYSKAAMLRDFDLNIIWNTTADLINETIPMLQTEREVIGHIIEQSDDYLISVYQYPWLDFLQTQWPYALAAFVALVITLLLVPWQRISDWVTDVIWRTIVLFLGVLPLDGGIGQLNEDKESGNYEVFIVAGAVALTLGVNYLVWRGAWWGAWQLKNNVAPRAFGSVTCKVRGMLRGKPKEICLKEKLVSKEE